ncbi:MAG TPA: TAXI family TRAP transporter solute-binding subunit [Alphaproteobacteria bacterium]|nr:TAXI family TRAP transporter solute-binding subunit [Alphaproteobacteria bacterium]
MANGYAARSPKGGRNGSPRVWRALTGHLAGIPKLLFTPGSAPALKLVLGAVVMLGLAAPMASMAPVFGQAVKFFRIGTGSTGGTYHPIGGLIASTISNPPGARPCNRGGACGPEGLIAVAQSTGGSVANVNAIRDGRLESGLSQADIAYWAHKGEHIFRGKGKKVGNLRAIANLYPEAVHLVVRRDAKIAKVADLRGKRVSLGPRDSGTRVDAEIILRAFGITTRAIKAQYMGPGPSADALRAGTLDAIFLVAGPPAQAIVTLANSTEIALIPITGKQVARLRKRYPFFSHGVIPAGAYKNAYDIETLTVGAQWVVSSDVPEDLVHAITRALWHQNARRMLDDGHPEGRNIKLETALKGLGIPLHPGAARYYREAGVLKGEPGNPPRKPAPDATAPAGAGLEPATKPAAGGATGMRPTE